MVLSDASSHLQAALDLLDGAGLSLIVAARISHALEDLRHDIAELGRRSAVTRRDGKARS